MPLAALTSCGPLFYVPNGTPTPLFSHGKELAAGGNLTEGGYEFYGAGSVTDHILVLGSTTSVEPEKDQYDNGGKASIVEGGAGYYSVLQEKFAWGVNGMMGKGKMENNYPPSQGINASMFRYSVTPYIGYMTERFEGSAALRFTGMNYSSVNGSLVLNNKDWVEYLRNHAQQFFIEPSLTVRFGYKYAFLQAQWVKSFNLTDQFFPDKNSMVCIGLHLKYSFDITPKERSPK